VVPFDVGLHAGIESHFFTGHQVLAPLAHGKPQMIGQLLAGGNGSHVAKEELVNHVPAAGAGAPFHVDGLAGYALAEKRRQLLAHGLTGARS
jgi:hypothetical protein